MKKNQVNRAINKLKDTLALDDKNLKKFMKMNDREYLTISRNFSLTPVINLMVLAESLNIDFNKMMNCQLDYKVLRKHYLGDTKTLPQRYSKYKESRINTIINVFDYLENKISFRTIQDIKNSLQLPQNLLNNPSKKVCGLLLMDIFNEVAKIKTYFHRKDISFEQIGERLCRQHISKLYKKFSQHFKTPKDVYETTIEMLYSNVERNLRYQIAKSSDKSILIEVTTREEAQDILKLTKFGNKYHYENIIGYYMGIGKAFLGGPPKIIRRRPARNQELRFEIDFSPLPKLSSGPPINPYISPSYLAEH